MSLRARILVLFLGLGVVPILLLGVIGYARSMRAVRDSWRPRLLPWPSQAASEIQDRYELRLSELLLLAENAETQRLFQAHSGRTRRTIPDSAVQQANAYLAGAWSQFGDSYQNIQIQDEDRADSPLPG